MTEQRPQIRVRVSVGRTSKGAPSYDCTVEGIESEPDEKGDLNLTVLSDLVLAESQRVESLLRELYGSEWEK